uniref:Uncharacterized protein n=1 Tax=Oryza barthii TaxID=65489 RepID=A0A0D3H521_9ORYZ
MAKWFDHRHHRPETGGLCSRGRRVSSKDWVTVLASLSQCEAKNATSCVVPREDYSPSFFTTEVHSDDTAAYDQYVMSCPETTLTGLSGGR